MKVEIWSDIACPFCYIGKRKFENALTKFADKENVEVIWKSYQLDPSTQHTPGMSVHDYLAEKKGFSVAQAKEMNDYVTGMASEVGLLYDFEKTVVANTFNAHRLIHLAAKYNLQDQAEESLFSAYFTKGKNIQDKETLIELGLEIGLEAQEVRQVLEGSAYADEVRKDFADALKVGVRGVPFFLFNNKYTISGAQSSDVFSQVLEKVWDEEIQVEEQAGGFCTPDGDCK
jgi:predicted DsbA family dithiol-disulfide isomerase